VPKDSPLEIEKKGVSVLLDDSVKKIAIANPTHAPYGRAAVAAMKSLGVYEAVEKKIVAAENIAQAGQFVESGAAQVGLLAHSIAEASALKEKGRYALVPRDSYPPIEQAGVILSWTKSKESAEKFRAYLKEGTGRDMLAKAGFLLPEK
jgi:molybdate transport system substrate-binding protein